MDKPQPKKSVSDMATELIGKIRGGKARAKIMKRPAGKTSGTPAKKPRCDGEDDELGFPGDVDDGGDDELGFPGIEKQPAIKYKNVSIYTSVPAKKWRVLRKGDRVDKPFLWSKEDPSLVWDKLVEHVRSITD